MDFRNVSAVRSADITFIVKMVVGANALAVADVFGVYATVAVGIIVRVVVVNLDLIA